MRKYIYVILGILLLLSVVVCCNAQTGQKYDRYFFTGSMSIDFGLNGYSNATLAAQDSGTYAPVGASLRIGRKGVNKATIINTPANIYSVPSPQYGMIAFDTTLKHFYGYNGVTWKILDSAFGGSTGGTYTFGYGLDTTTGDVIVDTSKIRTVLNSYTKAQVDAKDAAKLNITDTTNKWLPIGYIPPTLDTSGLSNRIDQKVKYTDTSLMLAPYFRKNDTAGHWLPIGTVIPSQIDTTSLSTRINLRLRYQDTASMLLPYLRKVDTTGKWLPIGTVIPASIDTTSLSNRINQRVKYTDTASMLAPYLRSAVAAATYQPLLGFTPENVANKKTTVSASNTEYPSGQAVINYVTGLGYSTGTNIGSSKIGNQVSVTSSNGTGTSFSVADGDSSVTNEVQNLTSGKIGSNVTVTPSLSGAATTFNISDADSVVGNEYQNVSRTGKTVSITNGTGFDLPDSISTVDKAKYDTAYARRIVSQTASRAGVNVTLNTTLGSGQQYISTYTDSVGGNPFNSVIFNQQAPTTYNLGQLAFDTTCDCLTFDGVTSATRQNIGQELWENVYNNTGSTITAGQAVYITGGITIAGEVYATVALAQANSATTTVCIGLATENISNGSRGKVTTNGTVHSLNTSALSVGNVFLSSTVAGGLTNTPPSAPNFRYRIGIVSSISSTIGTIKVTGSTTALGNGAANQVFGMNSAGTAQEVKTVSGGTFVGVTHTTNNIAVNLNATGTPSASTVLLGNNTWAAPPIPANAVRAILSANINALSTGTISLFTTDATGTFVPVSARIYVIALSGVSPSGTYAANIGFNASTYDNIMTISASSISLNTVGKGTYIPVAANTFVVPASTGVFLRTTSVITGASTMTIRVDISGYYTN